MEPSGHRPAVPQLFEGRPRCQGVSQAVSDEQWRDRWLTCGGCQSNRTYKGAISMRVIPISQWQCIDATDSRRPRAAVVSQRMV